MKQSEVSSSRASAIAAWANPGTWRWVTQLGHGALAALAVFVLRLAVPHAPGSVGYLLLGLAGALVVGMPARGLPSWPSVLLRLALPAAGLALATWWSPLGSTAGVVEIGAPVLAALAICLALRRGDAGGDPVASYLRAVGAGVVLMPVAMLGPSLAADVGAQGIAGLRDALSVSAGFSPFSAWLATVLGTAALLPLLVAPGDPPSSRERDTAALLALGMPGLVVAGMAVPALPWLALAGLLLLPLRLDAYRTAAVGLLTGSSLAAVQGFGQPAVTTGQDAVLLLAAAALALLLAPLLAMFATLRRRSEELVARMQGRVRTLMEQGPALVATFDLDRRHRFANRNYLQWHGVLERDLPGRALRELYGDAVAAAMEPAIRRALAGQPQELEIELPDGRTLDAHIEPEFSLEGPVDGFHLLAHDSSWRGQQQRRHRALLDALGEATVLADAQGCIADCNATFETLVGLPAAQAIGQPLSRWLTADAAPRVGVLLDEAAISTRPLLLGAEAGLVARREDGSEFPLGLGLSVLALREGRQWVVTLRDLTLPLAAEQSIRESHEQARRTVNAIGDSVVVCDAQGYVTAVNPMAAEMTGWAEGDALGRPLDDVVKFTEPNARQELHSLLHDAMRHNRVQRRDSPKLLLRRDGAQRAVEESAAPIRDSRGRVIGGVVVFHDVTQIRSEALTLAHQAQHDHLTGLPNRVLLQDRLTQALAQMERGYKGALLYLDLDKFKPINDTLGHPVGDRVLQEVAARLRACVREDDTVSRQGGDEFVLLLVRLADPRDAARVAEKLIETIEQPIRVDGHDLQVSASIGIALFPQDGRDTQAITKAADTALYHAKDGGRGRYSYFTDVIGISAEERVHMEHDLRFALAAEAFTLVYQPRMGLPSRDIVALEALLRWPLPDGRVLLPEGFLHVAEETGLVVEIDEWVLRAACRQNRQWLEQGISPRPVSVNVSLARFDAERLVRHVRRVLDENVLDPQWLEIEFAGEQLFAQGSRGLALVNQLRAIGVRVAVDDYGAGHASLGELAYYPLHSLRIDRGFVRGLSDDPRARAVTQAVVAVGKALGIGVVAKGVESTAQEQALRDLGCDQIQGTLFSAPLDADEVGRRMKQQAPRTGLRAG